MGVYIAANRRRCRGGLFVQQTPCGQTPIVVTGSARATSVGDELKEEWPRFFGHWAAATFGFWLRSLLPVLRTWTDPTTPIQYPRWWVALLFALLVSLLGGFINSNLPLRPRELLKSTGLGFALDAASVLTRITPL